MIDIYFDKLYRYPRIQECVSIAVPFKKGELKDISEVAVLQNGRECVIQPRVTAWHNDGSVKYLFISFMADLPANKRAKLILVTDKKEYDDGIKASIQCQSIISTDNKMQYMYTEPEAARVSVEKTKKGYKVDSGAIRYEVADDSESIFTNVYDGRKTYTEANFEGPVLKDKDGNDYKLSIGEWRVVQSGPVEVILAARAHNIAGGAAYKDSTAKVEAEKDNILDDNHTFKDIEAEIRLTAYAGKPWVNVSYRIINTSNDELRIKSLVFYIKKSVDSIVTDKLAYIDIASGNDSTGCGDILTDNSHNDGPIFITRGIGELDMIDTKHLYQI